MQATMPAKPKSEAPKTVKTTTLRLPEELYKKVHRYAGARTLSANDYVLLALETQVAADEAEERRRILEA